MDYTSPRIYLKAKFELLEKGLPAVGTALALTPRQAHSWAAFAGRGRPVQPRERMERDWK